MFSGISVRTKLVLGFGIALLLLVVLGGVAYINTNALLDARRAARHTIEVQLQVGQLQIRLLDAETGQRGYLLTGEESYLQPYQTAIDNIERSLSEVVTMTQGNPEQQARLQTLSGLVRNKLDELARVIALRQQGTVEAAIQRIRAGDGKRYMNEIRSIIDAMLESETRLQGEREIVADRTTSMTLDSALYGTIGGGILLTIISFLITRSINAPVSGAVRDLTATTAEILAATTQLASGSQEQAAAVTETVSTVDEVTQTSEQAAHRARTVSEAAQRSAEIGKAGRHAVEETVSVMGKVKEQSESIAESILALAEQAQSIAEIIAAVNEIAEQTNLLALNAAIEASRAGEHGKGFAVVAGEVKALADQSKKATAQVRQILGEIQKATNGAVIRTEEGSRSVNEAITVVTKAGDTIRALADTITEAAQLAAQISASAGQQATGMTQIHQAMKNINQVATQNMVSTKQTERAAQDLDSLSAKLRLMIAGR
jgi:methyl-accepting chemotaxis protein